MSSHIWKFFAVSLLLLVAVAPQRARAQTLFTVSGIHVDATAASSTIAFNEAVAQGRAKAFQILYRRLTKTSDWGREPQLDLAGLVRISRGYEIANELRSTTRYVADVTYEFNPEAVERLLRASSIAYSKTVSRPVLAIAMAPGASPGPWAQALANPQFHGGMVPLLTLGADDDQALQSLNFDSASFDDVSAIAQKYHVNQVALIQAVNADGKITVNIRLLASAEPAGKTTVDVPIQGNVNASYPLAAQAAIQAIDDIWKARTAIDFSQRGHLSADVRIANLAQWGELQSALSSVSNVTGVEVTAMDMSYARIQIAYIGGLQQLRDALAAQGLVLSSGGPGQWMLAGAGDGDVSSR